MNAVNLSYFGESVVKGILIIMEDKSMFKKDLKLLINILKRNACTTDKNRIPPTVTMLYTVLYGHKDKLLSKGIHMSCLNPKSVRFDKVSTTTISTKIQTKDEVMKTNTYKKTFGNEVMEVLKEMSPISSTDIALLTSRSTDSIRSMISMLRREGCNIVSKSADNGTHEQLYYIDHSVKAVTPKVEKVVAPKPELKIATKPSPVCNNKATKDLINRAYYLMKALRKIDIDTLMDQFNLDEATATKVILALATEERPGVKLDMTLQDMS